MIPTGYNWALNGKTNAVKREDGFHQEGFGIIMLIKKAKQFRVEWKPINERLIYARFIQQT